jgi:ankyrin repeat protein
MKQLITTIAAVLLATSAFADPIHDAVEKGNLIGVQAELDKGVDVNAKREDGSTPLHGAAEGGHEEIVELLITEGADLHATTVSMMGGGGWIPLHSAARQGHRGIVELLIEAGTDVNTRDSVGKSTLHDAALVGHKEIVKLLIKKGADLNAKSGYYGTPLHVASSIGHKEIAVLLIANGADLNVQDGFGRTPLNSAELIYEWDSAEIKAAKKDIADLIRNYQLMPLLVRHGPRGFSFVAKEETVYEVQDSFDLLSWITIKTYKGTGSSVRFDDFRKHSPPQIFYRVRLIE